MLTKDPGAASESPVRDPTLAPTTLADKLLSLLRGDKYMVNAYPPQWRSPTAGPAPVREDLVAEPIPVAQALER
jgi:hypothetical protein